MTLTKRSREEWPLRAWVVLRTVVTTVLGLAILLIFARLQAGEWVWADGFYLNGAQWFDAARTTIALIGIIGLGGAAFLAYRKQRSTEAGHVLEETGALRSRYTTCAEQLGNDTPTIRFAGVFALAALADDWHIFGNDDERQVCIDLFCAYLRTPIPFVAAPVVAAPVHESSSPPVSRKTVAGRTPPRIRPKLSPPAKTDPLEKEVRAAIINVIRDHTTRLTPENKSWSQCRFNLTGANLTGADLIDADLINADLSAANLTDALLVRVSLAGADLTGADLTGANLASANLSNANLARANLASAALPNVELSKADLTGANLTGANLRLATLAGANVRGTILTSANLAGTDLTGIRHGLTTRWPARFGRPPLVDLSTANPPNRESTEEMPGS